MTHRARIRAICEARGIDIYRTEGGTLRLYGPGVDLITVDLVHVNLAELAPAVDATRTQVRTMRQRDAEDAYWAAKSISLPHGTSHQSSAKAPQRGHGARS